MYLGIDLGTSGVKVILVDDADRLVDHAHAPLDVSRREPLWSEQDPEDWWHACDTAMREIRQRSKSGLAGVRGIGLSGQMHGATLLDAEDRVLRPAILWNDGRSGAECVELERREPLSRAITGNLAMPGFTAPKLVWVEKHEPDLFKRVARVLLPKDWLRLRMTGEHASDMSDAAGTLWLDVGKRAWSSAMLAATHLDERRMPRLFEGSAVTGTLRRDVADSWGMTDSVVVAGGAGDNAAGAVGVGVIDAGQALLSLGTSGVIFVANDAFRPYPEGGVHAFCHCLPSRWHQMSVILSAASCLSWVARATRATDEAALLAEVEVADRDPGALLFLPYLSGERTPHNDPDAKGVFFGLGHETTRADLARAVLEGVAFAFADGQQAIVDAGTQIADMTVIGGGARSALWGRILASALDRPLVYREGAEIGPAAGAARLARLAVTGEVPGALCTAPPIARVVEPDPPLRDRYAEKLLAFRHLYREIRPLFRAGPTTRAGK